MITNNSKAPSCTCPSGDGSLVHPCPAHPASVKQAGGDERAAFEAAASKLGIYTCNFERYTEETAAHENRINARVEDPVRAGDYRSATLQDCWKVWQEARATLAHAPTSSASPSCKWTESSGIWETGCGQTWSFIEDGPAENGALFCHHCGGRLVLIKSDDQEDDGHGAKLNRISEKLERYDALLAARAEIERLDRAAASQGGPHDA
ncbi:hypothetical protein ACP0HU_08945 [Pseudomonas aeruginosa]|uniref:hypothetical protein n=1 Tax=Pseudomonas aeruginosa TaxID=287 RepID=UPI002096EB14|nr:hypothetical protein [Pseudomonas aeruginosa]MCO7644099.1 hypothetical protein [Pseudomonas aeruginosa]MCO7662632.1 hypothetical protein [Pseudomonas aeruginosa]MCO7669073.1 hypothetical protein [Pseudomonas aeruginosa]MCO7676508.1 hypothetical protein [Pseudomonas aeruginosa]MCO7700467.1 hypothetical protein [Pseudomonas aeruginosa]